MVGEQKIRIPTRKRGKKGETEGEKREEKGGKRREKRRGEKKVAAMPRGECDSVLLQMK